jgi:hypothetical protein
MFNDAFRFLRRNIATQVTMWVSEVVRHFGRAEIHDVVRIGGAVQIGEVAHQAERTRYMRCYRTQGPRE